jgi:hypothetical protein
MWKQAREVEINDVVLDRRQRFIVREIRVHPQTGQILFIDEKGEVHGPFHRNEIVWIEKRATGIRLSTTRFAEMLKNAERWDRRWQLSIRRHKV